MTNKKIFLSILIILTTLLFSAVCFATDGTSLETELRDSGNKSEHTLQDLGEGIENISSDIGNGVTNETNDIGRGLEDVFNTENSTNSAAMGTDGTNDYTATRTSTDGDNAGSTLGMSRTAWVWLIMAIVAIVIIALTWYYVTQNNETK